MGTGFGFIVLTFVEIFVLSGDIVAVGRPFYFGFEQIGLNSVLCRFSSM